MNHPDNLMLYVAKPEASAAFYTDLFGIQPVEQSPTFVLFVLHSGLKLALWSKHTVQPAPANIGGGCEFSMRVETRDAVNALYAKWRDLKADILMAPAQLDFGWSFVIADLDGHRLRVYALDPE
ncbi:VOC family protein [Pseudochrobactrum kiredjianiae]|uniref:VOC family protein n=1 Tax=Pseudochrobactrum kiredjianiae TaxID=386305 RepID=A0ABW3V9V1_9HYPH|nr:VOC family protein [Pseudochrobactrum kiredjianiae]MDM7851278.1 VOC family protein [Pseudochrobactrum kiredjianiae]